MQLFEELKALVSAAEDDAVKFYNKNNAAAGTRLRKALQDIKAKATDIRNDVQAKKKEA